MGIEPMLNNYAGRSQSPTSAGYQPIGR